MIKRIGKCQLHSLLSMPFKFMALFKGQVPVRCCSEVVPYGSALKEGTKILLRVNMLMNLFYLICIFPCTKNMYIMMLNKSNSRYTGKHLFSVSLLERMRALGNRCHSELK